MPDGHDHPSLRVPPIFFGLPSNAPLVASLSRLTTQIGDPSDPFGQWFIADNLITFGHTAGFRRDPVFVAAVMAANPKPLERALLWRTHTLCWAARSCLALEGD